MSRRKNQKVRPTRRIANNSADDMDKIQPNLIHRKWRKDDTNEAKEDDSEASAVRSGTARDMDSGHPYPSTSVSKKYCLIYSS
ncbi:MAG: hypothetical protein ACI3YI_13740 [Bacteroidaceae bacterium]